MNRRQLLAGATTLPVAACSAHAARTPRDLRQPGEKSACWTTCPACSRTSNGHGDYVAARMAAEHFGGHVLGAPIEVVQADLQNKVDVGLSIARHWIDEEKVDAIFGLGNSAVPWRCRICANKGNGSTCRSRRAPRI